MAHDIAHPRRWLLPASIAGLLTLPSGADPGGGTAGGIGVVCTVANPGNCQLPDQAGHGENGTAGLTSDANPPANYGAVDNFVPAGNGVVSSVCWWGFYVDFLIPTDCGPGAVPDHFTITYYNNSPGCPGGTPGTIKAGPFPVVANKAATGNLIEIDGYADFIEFEYTAAHPPVTVTAAQCTWIRIQNNTAPSECYWIWSAAPPGDGHSFQFGIDPPGYYDFDLAFCLNQALGSIGSSCLLISPPCVNATGPCGTAHPTPGCADPCCCSLVCNTNPLCCSAQWTQNCVDTAVAVGCPPLQLCHPEVTCQVYGDFGGQISTAHPGPGADEWLSADDFSPAQGGTITSLCWQGVYYPAPAGDSFTVRYFADANGLPGELLAHFSQATNTLQNLTRLGTLRVVQDTTTTIFQYSATHGAVDVVAGTCYWIEVSNELAGTTLWLWSLAEEGRNASQPFETLPREGNGRVLADGTPPDGYDFADQVGSADLAFCLGLELTVPACGFHTPFDTGPHEIVLFNGATNFLSWGSGNIDNSINPQRRAAQAFTLPVVPEGSGGEVWSVEQLIVECLDSGFVQYLNFEIFSRTALDVAPDPGDSLYEISGVPFDADTDINQVTSEVIVLLSPGTVKLPPGDYWLTIFGSNTQVPFVSSGIGWFTNAPDGINNACTPAMPPPPAGSSGCAPDPGGAPAGTPAMLRSSMYPMPGFGAYTLPLSTLNVDPINDPTPDPADLYNTAFRMRGRAFATTSQCPWDCGNGDGMVGIEDFLALLLQWNEPSPCDFDGGGVGISDFLALLIQWGNCPP